MSFDDGEGSDEENESLDAGSLLFGERAAVSCFFGYDLLSLSFMSCIAFCISISKLGIIVGDFTDPSEVLRASALMLLSKGSEGNDPRLDIVPNDPVVTLSSMLDKDEHSRRRDASKFYQTRFCILTT